MHSASVSTGPRVRPSAPVRCRAARASRSNASPFAASRRQGTLAAAAGGDRDRARTLDRAHARAGVRRRPAALWHVLPAGHPDTPMSEATTIRVVGTAGHVDHGKSTLLTPLPAIDPDRLREERERGMTIDL